MVLPQSCARRMAIFLVRLSMSLPLIPLIALLANSMTPELKRFMGLVPGYIGHGPTQSQPMNQHAPLPLRSTYQPMLSGALFWLCIV